MTSFERARVEGEELLKALGGSLEGGRRTRSSTRGTPATPPPPEKRARVSTPRRSKKSKEEAAEKVNLHSIFKSSGLIVDPRHSPYSFQESTQDEADNASKAPAAAADELKVVAENSLEKKNESVEKMEVDDESKVSESNSESAITTTVTKTDEKVEATSTTAATVDETPKADTNDAAAATSTIEIDDSSDDSNNQKLPNAQSNDAAVTQIEDAKSTEPSSTPAATENKVETVEKVSVEPTPTAADTTPAAPVPVDEAKVNVDVTSADTPPKEVVTVNDANSKPQEAANGTKQTSEAIPAIKIDEANETEKKTDKLVTCKCEIEDPVTHRSQF